MSGVAYIYCACDAMYLPFTCCKGQFLHDEGFFGRCKHNSQGHLTYIPPPPLFQFDFQSQVLSSIQHGTRTKKVEFTDITGYTSEVREWLSWWDSNELLLKVHILCGTFVFLWIISNILASIHTLLLPTNNAIWTLNGHMLNRCMLCSYKLGKFIVTLYLIWVLPE